MKVRLQKNVRTVRGKCRSWIRQVLNQNSFEYALRTLLRSDTIELKKWYESWALMRNEMYSNKLLDILKRLNEIGFALDVNSDELDRTGRGGRLAKIVDPTDTESNDRRPQSVRLDELTRRDTDDSEEEEEEEEETSSRTEKTTLSAVSMMRGRLVGSPVKLLASSSPVLRVQDKDDVVLVTGAGLDAANGTYAYRGNKKRCESLRIGETACTRFSLSNARIEPDKRRNDDALSMVLGRSVQQTRLLLRRRVRTVDI